MVKYHNVKLDYRLYTGPKEGGMEEKNKGKIEMDVMEKARKRSGIFSRFLQWISKGTAKAAKDGSFCTT